MEPDFVTSATVAELREQQKKRKDNRWVALLLAYRNPRKERGVARLRKEINRSDSSYQERAAILCFYRLVESKKKEETVALGKTLLEVKDATDRATIHAILTYWGDATPETEFETVWKKIMNHQAPLSALLPVNPYLYYLLFLSDFPKSESLAFYPRDGKYAFARFWMSFLSYDKTRNQWAKWLASYHEKPTPIRLFLSLEERELLLLLERNSFVELEDYLRWKVFVGRYPTLKTLSPERRKAILEHLLSLEAVSLEDGAITLQNGGFFFEACSNRAS